jgi:hypothetical protein
MSMLFFSSGRATCSAACSDWVTSTRAASQADQWPETSAQTKVPIRTRRLFSYPGS